MCKRLAKISAVLTVRNAGLHNTRWGLVPRAAMRSAIIGASCRPRSLRGLSISRWAGSFQLDFACLTSIKDFIIAPCLSASRPVLAEISAPIVILIVKSGHIVTTVCRKKYLSRSRGAGWTLVIEMPRILS